MDNSKRNHLGGFSVIEILVVVAILGFGLLAVAKLHTTMVANSAENKARHEALAIANSRLDELRNYSGAVTSRDEFETAYAATAGYVNNTGFAGNIAQYERTERITQDGTVRTLVVQVNWTDETGNPQFVELNSNLSWQNPRSSSDFLSKLNDPLVDSATGRARLGDGLLEDDAPTTSNDDGTEIYDAGNGDLGLVSGDQIVLTLEDACVNGSCIDFVTIDGRIYIDRATQDTLSPGDIFIQASDAAFCQRYFIADKGDKDNTVDVVQVTDTTTTVLSTANGDYDYFEYRCYVGGGWHGNIGILLAGGVAQNDKICLGDPVSTNGWEEPEISIRRSYRGMLYKIVNDSVETFVDSEGVTRTRYYSQGVADAVAIPAAGEPSHDFVISKMSSRRTTGDNCISQGVMVRPDSMVSGVPGAMFAGMPTDFVCFNSEDILDTYDPAQFGADDFCPYDPTDPPVTAYTISGTVEVVASNSDYLDTISINTSDGENNCTLGLFSQEGNTYRASYDCTIFDWGTGWQGYTEVSGQIDRVACHPSRISYIGISSSVPNQVHNCTVGNIVIVQGTLDTPAKQGLDSVTISGGGSCTIAGDGASYICQSNAFSTASWTGSVTFNTSGTFCPVSGLDEATGVAAYTNAAPGFYDLNLVIRARANRC
jgi:Tfp pilus assembly protein PilV